MKQHSCNFKGYAATAGDVNPAASCATYNPLNPHDQVARLRGSFGSISHDVNQPLNEAIQTHLGGERQQLELFSS